MKSIERLKILHSRFGDLNGSTILMACSNTRNIWLCDERKTMTNSACFDTLALELVQ